MGVKKKIVSTVFITFIFFALAFNIHTGARFINAYKQFLSKTAPVSIRVLKPQPPKFSSVMDIDKDGEGEVIFSRPYIIPGKQEISIFEAFQRDFNYHYYGEILVPTHYIFLDAYFNEKQDNYIFRFIELKNGQITLIDMNNRQDVYKEKKFECLPLDLSPYEDGFIKPALVDLDADGTMEMVVILGHFNKPYPRMVACYNMQTGEKLWYYRTGTGIVSAEFQDLNGNGQKEIVLSTYAANKEVELNDTNDAYSYVIVLDSNGNELWHQKTNEWNTYSWNIVSDLDNDGMAEIVSVAEFHPTRPKDRNKIIIFNGSTGEEKKMFPQDAVSFSRPFVTFSNSSRPRIYVGDSKGWIWMFDKDLKVINKIKTNGPVTVLATSTLSSMPAKKWHYVFAITQNRLLVFNAELTSEIFSFTFESLISDHVTDPAESLFIPIPTTTGIYGLLNSDKLYLVSELKTSFAGTIGLFVSSGLMLTVFTLILFNCFVIYFIYLFKTVTTRPPVGEFNGKNGDSTFIEIVQGILHNLKNPISTVLWTAEKIKRSAVGGEANKKNSSEMYAQLAGFLLDDVKTLKQQTNNLLRMIQIRKPRFRVQNLKPLLLRIFRHYRALLDQKMDIRLEMEEDIYLSLDDELYKEAFVNIVDNAVDAMPDGGKLTISAVPVISPVDGTVEEVLIEVEDTGEGIHEDDLQNIFTPFFSRKQDDKGTGIGLTICKRIIEAHKGQIEVYSRKGLGTKIAITLPVKTK